MTGLFTDTIAESTSGSGITFSNDIVPATPLSHRNMVINGAMQVAQRATSSGASSGYNNLDRFRWTGGGHASMAGTIAQVAVTDLAGFSKCLKYTVTTEESSISANEYWWMHTRIEGQDLQCLSYGTSNARTCTLSFYVRCNVNGTYAVSIQKPDITDQIFGSTYTVSNSNWQRVSITIPANTAQGIADDNGVGFDIRWVLFAGSDYTGTDNTSWVNTANGAYAYGHSTTMGTVDNSTWEITGVQLELGSVATPFEMRSYGEELARCQRYYQKWTNADVSKSLGLSSMVGMMSSSIAMGQFQYKTDMRTPNPDLEQSATNTIEICTGNGCSDVSSVSMQTSSTSGARLQFNGSFSGTNLQTNFPYIRTKVANAYLAVESEL